MKRYIHTADAVFALVLFCAFALSMLLILTTGATAYQDIRDATQNRYSENTCVDYIATKVRHFDESGSVYIDDVDGIPAICLVEEFEGIRYITYIYFHDGYVRELYVEEGYVFYPDDGQGIIEVRELTFELTGTGLIRVSCTGSGGGFVQTYLSTRSGEVAA